MRHSQGTQRGTVVVVVVVVAARTKLFSGGSGVWWCCPLVVLLAVAVAAEATATLLVVWADDRASETAAAVRTGAEGIVAAEVHRPRPKVLRRRLATAAHAVGRPRLSASEACTWAVAQSAPGQSIQGRRGCRPRSRGGPMPGFSDLCCVG